MAVAAEFELVLTSVTGKVFVLVEVVPDKTSTPLDDQVKFQGPMPVKTACTVFVSPLQTSAGPRSVTFEDDRGLIVMVWELARSLELPPQRVPAPKSTRSESL